MPATLPIFEESVPTPSPRDAPAGRSEPGTDGARRLRVQNRWSATEAGAALARDVARNPNNLLAHVQRVHLWVDTRHHDETWAALLDLFIALGPRGRALRERMLRAAEGVLPRDRLEFLFASLSRGLKGAPPHQPAPGSVLSDSRVDAPTDISPERLPPARDPLDEADTFLAAGKIDAARDILEAALAYAPARADLAGALLDIYRYTYDLIGLREMRARLGSELRSAGVWDIVERDIVLAQDDGH
jgi:hypothetical protein